MMVRGPVMVLAMLAAAVLLVSAAHAPGPGPSLEPSGYAAQMQSRAVDTRVQLEIAEGQSKGSSVGYIPTKPGFTYRFNEPPKEFTLDANSGEIRTNVILDREGLENDRYDLVVLSSQPTYPIEVRIVVTDINDNPPQFPDSSIAVTFSESAVVGTRLLLDAATDRDSGVNGIAKDYVIVDGNVDDKFKLALTTNPSGETFYLHLETTGKLDRETCGYYSLNISARDGGNPPKYGYLQVNVTILDVNDNPPIFDHSDYIVSLNESVPPGTQVLQVMATDSDWGDNSKITYYLQANERQFSVDPESGIILTTEILNCTQQNCQRPRGVCPKSCVFTVLARDHGSPRQDGRTYVTVNLVDANDHDPVIRFRYFPPTANFATVDENAQTESVVAAISVVDMDEGLNGESSVKIVSGNELMHFRLESANSFYIVRVNGVLDREEIEKYNLTIVATDKGSPPRSATSFLIIHVNDVNDHEPVFEKSEYSAILSELAPPGTYVASITATDEDTGVNAEISYDFINCNEHQWFDIDTQSGLITTKASLDREVEGTAELNVSARDGGPNPKWAYTLLKVTILDENDESPKFTQTQINVSLSENTPPRSQIATLTAIDHDQGTNGTVTYLLQSDVHQKYPNTFALDSLTGNLTTTIQLDREKNPEYIIHILAKDQGSPPQSSTATVFLTVEDVNDNSPEFYPQKYFVPVSENLQNGSSVLRVLATDVDSGDNAIITYHLDHGGDGLFAINSWNGDIYLQGSLRKTQQALFKLSVSARDKGNRKSAKNAIIEIIKHSYVEKLEFEYYNGYEFKVIEDDGKIDSNIGRYIGRVRVTTQSESVLYSITYGDVKNVFKIDERTGKITTAGPVDREEKNIYNLIIVARSGLAFGSTTVNISVLDINDNNPTFPRDKDEIQILENTAVGHEVYFARARDRDSGVNSTVSYYLTYNSDNLFRISESTGVIYLNRSVRSEPGTVMSIEVTASDGGNPPLSSKHVIVITVEDVNDHTPVFDHTSYETSLLESTPVNTRFFMISASDADLNLNGRISYTISEGNSENKFGIFPDGFLYVRSPLDREEKDYYSLSVTANDHGVQARSSQVPVVIHIIDENDNSPKFTNNTFTFSIPENEPPDTFVGKLTAVDRDIGRNAELIFLLSSPQDDFTIDPKNGFIKTSRYFDREALVKNTGQDFIALEAVVTDNGAVKLRDKVKVYIFVTDVNDNAPKFIRIPYKVQVSEGASVGTSVLRLLTTDADDGLNGDIFYRLISGDENGKFALDEGTGLLTLARSLDRETISHYELTVLAHDAGQDFQLSSTTVVSVEVLDENDNAPEFTQTETSMSVIETTPVSTELIQFHATDVDVGLNSEVLFSITSGNRKDTFDIDPNTGVLFLHKQLDYEELPSYVLNITASDAGNPRLSTTIYFSIAVIDANDNPPSFPNTAIVRQIREGIPTYTPIVTVTAEDPDSGINGMVSYYISHQYPDNNRRHFNINNATGVIHTLLPIDRESIDTFRLTVIAYDSAEPVSTRLSAEKLVTVIVEDINDNAPVFVSMNAAIVPAEELQRDPGRDGLFIMNIFARDLDSSTNGLVTYELVQNGGDIFRLHRSTGALTLRRNPGEIQARWSLAVKAADEAVQREQRSTVTYVTVIAGGTGSGEPLWSNPESVSVAENEPAGTSVATLTAILPDAKLEYYITNMTGDGRQVDRLFDVDVHQGILSTAVPLDRESGIGTYEVEICAVAVTGPIRTSTTKVRVVVLDKNDSPPEFKNISTSYTASEDLEPGQTIATITAVDPDTIGHITYSLVPNENAATFSLDKTTGVLKLREPLDRETKDKYNLIVRVSDGVQDTDVTITIQVLDTNDNPPLFSVGAYSFDVWEGAARGSRVGQVLATDPDIGSNAQIAYTVISDWANDVFSLNPLTGVFTLTSRLDYEEVQHYILVIQAQDSGQPALSSTVTVYCNVLDLNDNAPAFDPVSYSNEIFENATIGSPVVTVSATDSDSGYNGRIEYSITSGDVDRDFTINPNGTIRTLRQLDRESKAMYNLVVTAKDQAQAPSASLSSTVQVTITLKDVNDMSPEFVSPNETSVAENVALNTVVMTVKAIDKDEGRNGYIEYSLMPDTAINGIFSLGSVDGLLRASGKLDRELKSEYVLSVTAKDRGDPPRITKSNVRVTILDENDNSPVFDPKQYSASVPENASIGANVLHVSATDIDEGVNGRVRYSIASGDPNRDFSISEDTGVVRVAKNLNYERKSRYILTVRAEDYASKDSRQDTAELVISVQDINDNPPTFLDSPYLAYVMENVIPPNGGYVLTVRAYDADTPPFNNQVRYFVKEGDADLFRINASTGEISLMRTLDREAQAEYTLTLVAMDTGSPPLTGSGTVKIVVQDINDHSPEFERQSYKALVHENLPVGTNILSPVAVDKDIGNNAKIRYSLLGEKMDRFNIDPDTGEITTAISLDREETSLYHMTLMAQDSSATDPRATTVNLTIVILDENDNTPTFGKQRYEVYIPELTERGEFVFGAKASDNDIGFNSRIEYTLSGDDTPLFKINQDTGVIKANEQLSWKNIGVDKMYKLMITAIDRGIEPRSSTTELVVMLKPQHFFPKFTVTNKMFFTLAENVSQGRLVTKLSATSPKKGPAGNIQYAVAGGNVGDALKINSQSGEIYVTGKGLDYEVLPRYEVWFEVKDSDNPPLRTVIELEINVTDANDNAPVIENALYNASVLEEEPPLQLIVKIEATDEDCNENGQITYRLVDDFEGTFEIDNSSGEIYTTMPLDRETIPSYELIVEAVDNGTPQLTGSSTVMITVIDKNDNPPRFTRLFSVNVTENAEIDSFVIRVTSSDQDLGQNANATYSFTENPGRKFLIDPLSGNVTVAGSLDREQQDEYLLKVAAVDGAWRAETPLTITIQDQNDNAPEFEHSYYSFNFPELQKAVVFVGQVIATDRDKQGPNSIISYSFQQPSELFTVDPATGEIYSKVSLKYKQTTLESSPENMYSVIVLAIDNGKPPMSSECLVMINVIDANNNAPKFEHPDYLSPVPMGAAVGQRIMKVTAKDEFDFGINAEIDYAIIGGNATKLFNIDNQGWLSVAKTFTELGKYYELRVSAIDRGVPSQSDEASITFIVTGDNRNSPIFTALSYQVIVPENEPIDSIILIVSASDEDEGPNGMVRYKISGGNERKEFSVDSGSGAVTILQPLDFDTVQEYHLNITAQDLGFQPRQTTAMLTVTLTDVNDNSPQFNQSEYSAYLLENKESNSFVYKLYATDIDSPKNAIIQYAIIGGSGKDFFKIDRTTGTIFSKFSFDYEEANLYTLDVLAENPDSLMKTKTKVVVHITGVNEYYPRFVQAVFHFDVSESADIGTNVGAIQATDQDSGDDGKVFYLFVGSSNDKGFSINPQSGVIRVARSLDRETQNRVVLTVLAKNYGGIRGNDTDEAQVIVSIQDGNDPPDFLQKMYEITVSEDALVGQSVLQVKAVDKDVRPQNNQFSYSIIGGNNGHAFKIDPSTGDIATAKKLDRETIPLYSLTVGAIDTGIPPQTGTTTVKVILTDINDNGPTFDPADIVGYVYENEPPNTSVMTLSAKDPDLPPNGAPFSYHLVGGKHDHMVKVEKNTGIVLTTKSLDREITAALEIIIEVEDSGVPVMRSQHKIKIVVMDKNDSPSSPRSVHVLVFAFNEALPIGKIADVRPNDPDTSGDYSCRIVNTALPQMLMAGVLSVSNACELHASRIVPSKQYTLSVSGNDGKHSNVVSTVTVEFLNFDNSTVEESITLRIENMTASKFVENFYRKILDTLKEGIDADDVVFLYSIQEVDHGINLAISIKNADGIRKSTYTVSRLRKREESIIKILQTKIILPYLPCHHDPCENGGICRDEIQVHNDTRIIDTRTLILTSPTVSHDFSCHCVDGFTGSKCEKPQDPCLPNPCMQGGKCRRQGYEFQCTCPPSREGKTCELERGDVCTGNPCKNGGSCKESPDGSSFFCLCRPGYRGNQCEAIVDSCRPNPCLNDGVCISLKPGYKCSCTNGRYGKHCERATFGFNQLSYMAFPSLDAVTNDISLIFATTKPNSLLLYNYGGQTGGRSDFISIELLDGKAAFSFGGARTSITNVIVPGDNGNLADGNWHKITATRNGKVVSLSIAQCTENGDVCNECRPNDTSCYADDTGQSGTLNFNNQHLLIGGLEKADPVLERPGQIHTDDFVGCIHSVSLNGRALNLSSPSSSRAIDSTCGRSSNGPCSDTEGRTCSLYGKCIDGWKASSCQCGGSLIAPNCQTSLEPISISEGGFIEYVITEKHRRMQLLDFIYGGSTLWFKKRSSRSVITSSLPVMTSSSSPAKSISLLFRTIRMDGIILYAATDKHHTLIQLQDGKIMYTSKQSTTVNMTASELIDVVDGQWHNVTLHSHNRALNLYIDNRRIGDELDSAGVHDFLDPYLTALSLGGVRSELYHQHDLLNFEGCLANFTINNEIQPFNGSGSIFGEVKNNGKVFYGCHGPIGIGAAQAPDPLSIGITLVIVFFVILIVAILVSFVVFRLRKQKKVKTGSPSGKTHGIHSKQNGGPTIMGASNLVTGGNDSMLGRGLHPNDSNIGGFMSETGDIIRNVGGHHIVGPELLSKKYKEREIINSEHQRPQRPDIIEREVMGKSPALRDDHHPPLPPSSNPTHHTHDHPGGLDINNDIPEHYDLENASSIAPSDIDIVYHYKGYREAGGVRKYKATPPPIASYHHKHQTAQHRHSPHHAANAFPSRVPPQPAQPPPAAPRLQATPLARLSPSSELSSQPPRILTLHDISGKPLQSALLATTSSSGGVGKDALHSNSERSLNSPVMSQLSGQSSSASRKTPGAPQQGPPVGSVGVPSMGLTAKDIERLNARPQTSSLVSALDAVSSSSEAPRSGGAGHHLSHRHHSHSPPEDHHSSTTTDESGNDSFTCSEIEYDNNSLGGDKYSKADDDDRRGNPGVNNNAGKSPMMPPPYDAFDSSFRGSLSTLVASDDDLAPHMGGPLYRQANGSPSAPGALGWDYLLNWGPNFESLIGVFKDIAELPDSVNGRVPSALRLPNGGTKPSEEYV